MEHPCRGDALKSARSPLAIHGPQNSVGGISQTMLTATLRNLERDGMVVREIFPEVPPRVEYELTKLGLSMLEPMQGLIDWVAANWATVKKARERFDSKLK
jgi:DNA-binding HxlR family transcriptional regulator